MQRASLQTIRSKAKEWNLDPERIACYGGSAGAGISLWLAFHEDLADPNSDDPIARQSTQNRRRRHAKRAVDLRHADLSRVVRRAQSAAAPGARYILRGGERMRTGNPTA